MILLKLLTLIFICLCLQVMWLPYGDSQARVVPRTIYNGFIRFRDIVEPYMPGRVLRQLGYRQTIPQAIIRPSHAFRSWQSKAYKVEHPGVTAEDNWVGFPYSFALRLEMYQPVPDTDHSACAEGYLAWYYYYSHPVLLNEDRDDVTLPSRSNSDYVSWLIIVF